jgi:hypothetical protein
MAKRHYRRDRRGRFASTGSSRVKRVGKKLNRKRPRYIRGSAAKNVRVGRVGPGGEYAGVHAGVKLPAENAAGSTTLAYQQGSASLRIRPTGDI